MPRGAVMTWQVIAGAQLLVHRRRMRRELLAVSADYRHPPEVMWPIVSDLSGYADHVTDLESSPVLSGSGAGAMRQCNTTGGDQWTEEVSQWHEGVSFELEVDTSTYPTPLRQLFRRFTGKWEVRPHDAGSQVQMTFVPDVRGGWLVWPLVVAGSRRTRRDLLDTLDSYGAAADLSGGT